MQYHQKCRCL